MPLLTDYNNAQNTDFQYRVQMALVSTANNVQAESVATAFHAARSALALRVLADPPGLTRIMAPGFTANKDNDATACDLTATDAALLARASSIWNNYAVQG